MADRYYSNADTGQRFQPGTTAEAGQVDQKFDEVTAGFQGVATDTDRALKLPAEADTSQALTETALERRNKVVGFDKDGNLVLTGGFTWRDDWATATEYFVNDVFRDATTKNIYVVKLRHTSTVLADDIAAGKDALAISVAEIEQFKAAAQAARDKAKQWAEETTDTEVETGAYSAKHHAAKSLASASASSSSATESATARDKSQQWADEAVDAEVETGKYSAKHHATKASGSATSAASSASAAADAYDAFDDRYLGAKSSDPTTDNDGDPIQVGALYFSSTTSKMREWNGSAWQNSYATVNLQGDATGPIDMAGFPLSAASTQFARYDLASTDATDILDLSLNQVFRISVTGNVTIGLANTPGNGRSMTVVLHLYDASLASRTITWPPSIYWADGSAPTLDGTKATIVLLWTGSEWVGSLGVLS